MTSREAFIKEYRSVYLEDPNFENIDDLDLYSWWQWACEWQKKQDIAFCEENGCITNYYSNEDQ